MSAEPQIRKTRLLDEETARMATEVRQSLSAERPWLPSRYFYDDRGSRLFEEITRLPEYYQTRTEEALLEERADEVAGTSAARELVEVGSGAGRKIRTLLRAMRRAGRLDRCLLFDINELFVRRSVTTLSAEFPGARFTGVVGDFTLDLGALGPGGERLAIFLGGTIGNLEPPEATRFLSRLAGQLAPGDAVLLGVDLVKDAARLHAAYNDAAGVTAAFNRNILRVVNDRLEADFDPDDFDHVAFYDAERAWIEMRLRARRDLCVTIPASELALRFARGDEIRTEISCKYTRESLERALRTTRLGLDRWYTDRESLFGLALLRRGSA